jgi:hypothetical protein
LLPLLLLLLLLLLLTVLCTCFAHASHMLLHMLCTCCCFAHAASYSAFSQAENLGQNLAVLRGHTASITLIDFHPKLPSALLSASNDGTVRIWDARDQHFAPLLLLPHDGFGAFSSISIAGSGSSSGVASARAAGAAAAGGAREAAAAAASVAAGGGTQRQGAAAAAAEEVRWHYVIVNVDL